MAVTDWRITGTHGLHITDGERPVATFHDSLDARVALGCVQRVNGASRLQEAATPGARRPSPVVADWPLIVKEVAAGGHPFYGDDMDEVLRDYALAVQNALYDAEQRVDSARREAAFVRGDTQRVNAVRAVLREGGKRKTLEAHAVSAALEAPEWRLKHAADNGY